MVSVQARREQAHYAIQRGLNHRRACTLLSTNRSSLFYSHKMPVKDHAVIEAMKKLSGAYPRFGSRRIRVFLKRGGIEIGKERCSRSKALMVNLGMSVYPWNGSAIAWKPRW